MRLSLRKLIVCALLTIFLACAHFVFAKDAFLPFTGELNSDSINVRSDSTINAAVICVLNKSEKIEVISEFFEWYKIRLPKNAPSYISKRFVACVDEAPQTLCRNGRVINNKVNVRLKPSESSAILAKLNKTDQVSILSEEKGWYKIEPVASSHGWVHKKFVDKLPEPAATVKAE